MLNRAIDSYLGRRPPKPPNEEFWLAGPLKRGSITPKIEIFLGVDDLPRQEFDDRVGVNGKRDVFSRWRVLDRGR